MSQKEPKIKKPENKSSKKVLLILAQKIKIMDEQILRLRVLADELENRVIELENRLYEGKEAFFESDFDWGDEV